MSAALSIYQLPENPPTSAATDEARDLRDIIRRRRESMRQPWRQIRPMLQQVSQFIDPWSGEFLWDSNDQFRHGTEQHAHIINNTATRVYNNARAGLSSLLTPASSQWWGFEALDPGLKTHKPAQEWLELVVQLMVEVQQSTNFYTVLENGHGDAFLYGTGSESMDPHPEMGIQMTSHPIGTYLCDMGPEGRVDTFYEEISRSVDWIVRTFGMDNVSRQVRQAYNSHQLSKTYRITHAVEPNDDRIPGREDWRGKPYRGIWMETADAVGGVLRYEGFDEFPNFTSQWSARGNFAWGYGPMMASLGDIRELQEQEQIKREVTDIMADPTTAMPSSMFDNNKARKDLRLAGGRIPLPPEGMGQQAYPVYSPAGSQLQAIQFGIETLVRQIEFAGFDDTFFPILSMWKQGTSTATEVNARRAEALQRLGPFAFKQTFQRIGPMLDRQFNIMLRQERFPEPPDALQGQPIKAVFKSPIAQALRQSGIANLEFFTSVAANMSAVWPESRHSVDFNFILQENRDKLDLPADVMRSEDEANQRVEQEAQAAAQAQMAQNAALAGKGAKDASQADTTGENALTRVVGRSDDTGS